MTTTSKMELQFTYSYIFAAVVVAVRQAVETGNVVASALAKLVHVVVHVAAAQILQVPGDTQLLLFSDPLPLHRIFLSIWSLHKERLQ